MSTIVRRTRDQHFFDPGPKRILALDGGGVRGILTLGVLERIERLLGERYGDAELRLSDYFDLVAGTSTGAIIAAALAKGMRVAEIRGYYHRLAGEVFKKSLFRKGLLRAKYNAESLSRLLRDVLGEVSLGSPELQTGLLAVLKRLDTGSPWPVSNNPKGKYFGPRPGSRSIPNGDYPLWKVVRASTAAPSYFDPERIVVARDEASGQETVGTFVDGGVSTANNPALQALMFATLDGFRVGWEKGADKLLLISVGTGAADPSIHVSGVAAPGAVQALLGLMNDAAALVEMILQWLSQSSTARTIDREVGDLAGDLLAATPVMSYQRYNAALTEDELNGELSLGFDGKTLARLKEMDDPANVAALERVGLAVAERVQPDHFPKAFDL